MPRAKVTHDPNAPPEYTAPDPRVTGRCDVVSKGHDFYTVDLATNVCDCEKGAAFFWADWKNQWVVSRPCVHKVQALAELVVKLGSPDDLAWIYIRSLGTRYNAFEVVSAFHKELRRGDFRKAYFWGMMLYCHRRGNAAIDYMLGILYEETRDHQLGFYLLDHKDDTSFANIATCIKLFCISPKKWEMPHREKFFFAEMRAYSELADEFSDDVGKPSDIIPYGTNRDRLITRMKLGAESKRLRDLHYGVKGLLKTSGVEHDALRWYICLELHNQAARKANVDALKVFKAVARRRDRLGRVGYHDVNALADAVGGEAYSVGLTSRTRRNAVIRRPNLTEGDYEFPFGVAPLIPLYGHDNHTWRGKALMKKYPDQLLPGREQTDLDFRYCGAYFGVAYRTISVAQHGHVAEWHEVKWPRWLHTVVMRLWY